GVFERPGATSAGTNSGAGAAADPLRSPRPVEPDVKVDVNIEGNGPRQPGGVFRPGRREPVAGDLRGGGASDPIIAAAVRALRDRIESEQGRRERGDLSPKPKKDDRE